ncbi:hypothetical protein LMTR13_18035 [Bradyrhizobium icense]|uniref:Uncharacterized protein n=1 Tax=Bradyrhizobium icense TaxID=1274631 RepID=A0A1B1UGA0_9BRAD|nr:hypothetical protein LMTR13_18035 [Bradyrhizobium icense]
MRRPYEELDFLLAGVFDGDTDALFALIADSSIDGFVREALFGAATFLAWERRIDRDRLRAFLVRFYEERLTEDGDQAWTGWQQAIALLGLRDLVPLVDDAWREGRIPDNWTDRAQFDDDLAAAERAPDDIDRFTQVNLGSIEDALVSLDWARGSENDVFEERYETSPWADLRIRTSRSKIPAATSDVTILAPAGAARKPRMLPCQRRTAGVTPATSMRRHPGTRLALCGRDFRIRHHRGDLAAHRDCIGASLQRGEIEPFVGRDEIHHAGTAARPVKAALEQHVRNRGRFHRNCRVEIDLPLKHR